MTFSIYADDTVIYVRYIYINPLLKTKSVYYVNIPQTPPPPQKKKKKKSIFRLQIYIRFIYIEMYSIIYCISKGVYHNT